MIGELGFVGGVSSVPCRAYVPNRQVVQVILHELQLLVHEMCEKLSLHLSSGRTPGIWTVSSIKNVPEHINYLGLKALSRRSERDLLTWRQRNSEGRLVAGQKRWQYQKSKAALGPKVKVNQIVHVLQRTLSLDATAMLL